jgi:hypothetical protein
MNIIINENLFIIMLAQQYPQLGTHKLTIMLELEYQAYT